MKYVICLMSLVLILQGCASIEEGEVDYVRTIANKAIDSKTAANCSADTYAASEYARAGFTRACYETLYRKYTKVPEIKKDDTISIHLMQAFIGFAKERRDFSESLRRAGANAEIVIIANVCEQGVAGCSLRFGPESDKAGRVIYYSNGVKAKQYLNFSYLPVYGPIKYQGGPLIMQLSILELDSLSEQQKNLLKTLADAGKKAYPPASKVLSVLDSVGSSLLAGGNDDIIFRYTMSLVPDSSKLNYQSPIVAEGNFAFIRKNTLVGELEKEVVDELKFDHLTGRLVKECNEDEQEISLLHRKRGKAILIDRVDYNPCTIDVDTGRNFKDYRENTYLTFQIKSGFSESTLDNLQTFDELLGEIHAEKDDGAIKAVEAFSNLKKEIVRNSQQRKLLKGLDDVKKSLVIIPEDTLEFYNNQVYRLFDEYNGVMAQYKQMKCAVISKMKPGCKFLMTSDQLMTVQLQIRTMLDLINPGVPPISIIPSGFNDLKPGFGSEFEKGYRLHFNSVVFRRYLNDVGAIKNIADNTINLNKKDKKGIESRNEFYEGQVKLFLDKFSRDLSLSTKLSCSGVDGGNCYRYLSADQITEVSTIFNQFAESHGLAKGLGLTDAAKSASENIEIVNSLIVYINKKENQ